jgi:NAD-dependent dihydropyrimidine dehydrogenase PreA subunit
MIAILEECCVGCALCVPFCPEEAISCYGRVAVSETCTECLSCLEFCPVGALKEPEPGE